MSPHHVIYFKASHSPLDHIVSSRPLIGSHHSPQKKQYKELFIYMNNWDKGMATAVCPCIFSASEFWKSAGAAPPDFYLLMYLSL